MPHVSDPRIAGLLLAAGASRRLGAPKQLILDETGEPMVRRVARDLLAAGCSPILVIVGASADAVIDALHGVNVEVALNPEFADGMGTSIACGVRALQSRASRDHRQDADSDATRLEVRDDTTREFPSDIRGCLIAACDMPTADAPHFRALVQTSALGARRVCSDYIDGSGPEAARQARRGIPAVFPHTDFAQLASLSGDRGAKPLLSSDETLSVPLVGGTFDLDTPADVEAWRAAVRTAKELSAESSTE